MRHIYLFTVAVLTSFLLQGQSVLHYNFNSTLAETNGNGPTLTVLGDAGFYQEDALGEIGSAQKWVYHFEANSGFQLDNTASGNFLGDSYTIEIYFVFDELASWKRVVDWKNRKSDNGAYVYNGQLNFYPFITSGEAPVVAGEYTYYVITRNASTSELLIYTDASVQISMTDAGGNGLLDEDNVLNFFHDDLVVANEASSGAVAMLNIYNFALDENTIQDNYDDLAGNVFFIGENRKTETTIETFPNPANNNLSLNLSKFESEGNITIKLFTSTGKCVFNSKYSSGDSNIARINTSNFSEGLYLLSVESDDKNAKSKVIIQH